MSKWTRDITWKDFDRWYTNLDDISKEDFFIEIEELLQELESMDYFGTEGFDKRFG